MPAKTFGFDINDRVRVIKNGKTFPATVAGYRGNEYKVLPDEGYYFSDQAERREISVPATFSADYSSNNRIISRL